MVIYTCNNCDYVTTRKSNYIRHVTRKNKCGSIKKLYTNYVMNNLLNKNSSDNINTSSLRTQQISQNVPTVCKFCLKTFSSRQSRWRHENNNCYVMKQQKIKSSVSTSSTPNIVQVNPIMNPSSIDNYFPKNDNIELDYFIHKLDFSPTNKKTHIYVNSLKLFFKK